MTPYALPEAIIARGKRRAAAVRALCRQILEALAKRHPDRSHVRYWDAHVSLCYWPKPYTHTGSGTSWQDGLLMETHGVRFFNELEGRVLLTRDGVAAGLAQHLPELRQALATLTGALA